MSGVEFGAELKQWRQARQVSSHVLSQKAGKAVTYVSQLERGLIKNPDFQTCFRLLKELGFDENKIGQILSDFDIFEVQPIEMEEIIRRIDEGFEWEDTISERSKQWGLQYHYKSLRRSLNSINESIYKRFKTLIDYNIDKANEVVRHVHHMTDEPSTFEFFCSLMAIPIDELTDQQRANLLLIVSDFVEKNVPNRKGQP